MITINYYINQYDYPEYGANLGSIIRTQQATPVRTGINSGTLKVEGGFKQFFDVNYISIIQDGSTRYAWITDIQHLSGERLWELTYQVDAFRTYLSRTNFGNQYVERYYTPTTKIDSLIGSNTTDYSNIEVTSTRFDVGDAPQGWRTLVVQISKAGDTSLINAGPVQPSPYALYLRTYDMRAWTSDTQLMAFFNDLINKEEPTNLVGIYSVPYIDISPTGTLPLEREGGTDSYSGFSTYTNSIYGALTKLLNITLPDVGTPQAERLYTIDIPTAGQIIIPRYMVEGGGALQLERLIDLYSGSTTYNLLYANQPTGLSVTAPPIADIPIAYDGRAQTLAVMRNGTRNSIYSMLTPSNVSGIAGNAMTGFSLAGPMGAVAGATLGAVADPLMNTLKRQFLPAHGDIVYSKDGGSKQGGINTFLIKYEQTVFITCQYASNQNADNIHNRFGYVHNTIVNIAIPTNGYIKTLGCTVRGNIPKWARDSINDIMDSGLRIL